MTFTLTFWSISFRYLKLIWTLWPCNTNLPLKTLHKILLEDYFNFVLFTLYIKSNMNIDVREVTLILFFLILKYILYQKYNISLFLHRWCLWSGVSLYFSRLLILTNCVLLYSMRHCYDLKLKYYLCYLADDTYGQDIYWYLISLLFLDRPRT